MKNLQSLKKFKLSKEETKKINGGSNGQEEVLKDALSDFPCRAYSRRHFNVRRC